MTYVCPKEAPYRWRRLGIAALVAAATAVLAGLRVGPAAPHLELHHDRVGAPGAALHVLRITPRGGELVPRITAEAVGGEVRFVGGYVIQDAQPGTERMMRFGVVAPPTGETPEPVSLRVVAEWGAGRTPTTYDIDIGQDVR